MNGEVKIKLGGWIGMKTFYDNSPICEKRKFIYTKRNSITTLEVRCVKSKIKQ